MLGCVQAVALYRVAGVWRIRCSRGAAAVWTTEGARPILTGSTAPLPDPRNLLAAWLLALPAVAAPLFARVARRPGLSARNLIPTRLRTR